MATTAHHIVHRENGDVEHVVRLNDLLEQELSDQANALGIRIGELLTDLCITAFRVNVTRNYPSFTVPEHIEPPFVDDGFRVVQRLNGTSTLCPYSGMSFEAASAAMQECLYGVPDHELFEVA